MSSCLCIDEYKTQWMSLRKAPVDIWIIYTLKFLESYAHFSLAYIQILYFTQEFGYTDQQAGLIYGLQGMLHFLYGVFMGVVIDNLGVKWSLIIGNIFMVLSRLTICFTSSRLVLEMTLYVFLPIGTCLGIPVMSIAVRRYTTKENRNLAYSLFYVCLNLAAAVAAPLIDGVRLSYAPQPIATDIDLDGGDLGDVTGTTAFNPNAYGTNFVFTPYRVLILSGALTTFIALLICIFFIKDIAVYENEEQTEFVPKKGSHCQIFSEIMSQAKFWRFFCLMLLLTGLKMTFRHLDATFPSYMVRTFGNDALFGTIIGINPIMIIIGVLAIAPFLAQCDTFLLLILGGFLTALGPFALVLGSSTFNSILFVFLLSLGEIFWSPRLYEYTNNVADEGREGTYTALANLPMFAATLLTGQMSGALLSTYCPSFGNCDGAKVWALIGVVGMTSPVCLAIFRTCLYKEEDFKDSYKKSEKILTE